MRISQSPHSASLIAHTRLTFSFYNLRNNICALPALWVGLLYDAQALADAEALVSDWTAEEREYLRTAVTKGTTRAIPKSRHAVLPLTLVPVQTDGR